MSAIPVPAPDAGAGPRVALLDIDDGFSTAVPPAERSLARRVLDADVHDLPPGRWTPDDLPDGEPPFALLLTAGALLQEVVLTGRATAQLLGPGDLLLPRARADTELPCSMRWTVLLGGAGVAVIDHRYVTAARRWPDLLHLVRDRLGEQLGASARHAAVCALPRVEDRVLALFWELASRWGRVRPDAIVLRLPLTHEVIGRMIGAKRPTVSLALTALAAAGRLERRAAGEWVLSHASRAALGGAGPAAAWTRPPLGLVQQAEAPQAI